MKLGRVTIKWEKRDIWLGVFRDPQGRELLKHGWNDNIPVATAEIIKWYVCPFPCLLFYFQTCKLKLVDDFKKKLRP